MSYNKRYCFLPLQIQPALEKMKFYDFQRVAVGFWLALGYFPVYSDPFVAGTSLYFHFSHLLRPLLTREKVSFFRHYFLDLIY